MRSNNSHKKIAKISVKGGRLFSERMHILVVTIMLVSLFASASPVGAQSTPTTDIVVANCPGDSIQRITPAGIATTIASGFSLAANCVASVVFDDSGNAVFVGPEFDPTIYKVGLDGTVSVFVSGPPLVSPVRLAKDGAGNLIVADEFYPAIIKVTPSASMSVVASGFPLVQPTGIDIDSSGNYIVVDPAASAVFRVTLGGSVTTVADFASSGGLITDPADVRVDSAGDYIVVNGFDLTDNNIVKVTPGGSTSVIISPIDPNAGGTVGLTIDSNGNYLVSDQIRPAIYVITPSGSSNVFLAGPPLDSPVAIALVALASTVQVTVDIKPGSSPNRVNLNSKGNVRVAILGSEAFDATTVDPSTVIFACASPLPTGISREDVNGDGLLDVVLLFKIQNLCLKPGDTQACLSGKTFSDEKFQGCDSVLIVK